MCICFKIAAAQKCSPMHMCLEFIRQVLTHKNAHVSFPVTKHGSTPTGPHGLARPWSQSPLSAVNPMHKGGCLACPAPNGRAHAQGVALFEGAFQAPSGNPILRTPSENPSPEPFFTVEFSSLLSEKSSCP